MMGYVVTVATYGTINRASCIELCTADYELLQRGLCPADVSFLFSIDGMSMILLGRSLYMM
jgi:hypothetical protein